MTDESPDGTGQPLPVVPGGERAPDGPAAAPPPSPARPRRHPRVATAVVAGVLLLVGAGVAVADGDPEPTATTAAETVTRPSPVSTTAAAPTTPPAPPPTTAPPSPSPEPTSAPPSPKPPKPRVIAGRGDDVVRIPELTDLAIVKFTCRCSGNTVLRSDGPDGLLVNEIGAYTGKRWINLEDDSLTTQFEIEATGRWTLTIGTVAQLATEALDGTASGKGDDVILLGGYATAVRITHRRGSSNFVVHAYSLDTGEGGLLVNEIGGYSGTRPLTTPALVQVTADGNWTIKPD